jgi:drug/metabolite transporter (DMT)-like permease
MIPILMGIVAAAVWAASAMCIRRSTQMMPPVSILGWVLLIGAAISAPFALAESVPDGFGAEHAAWLGVTAFGNTVGLLCVYTSLRLGKVGVVTPITSAQGAAAAAIAVLAGEQLATGAGLALGVIVVGVVLSSMRGGEEAMEGGGRARAAVTYALCAALFFGLGLYAMGRLSDELPISWIIFPSRALGVLGVTVPLALMRRLPLPRSAVPLVVASGLLEVAGLVAYTYGARYGIAVTAVLASQFAAFAAVGAYVVFRERLARVQVAGVAVIAVGVAVLTGLQA